MSLELKDVCHIYQPGTPNETMALDHINLELKEGAFIGIIGHTGSGKSTLIQHLNGLLEPSSGHVLVDGVDIHKKSDKKSVRKNIRLKVGMVFQYPEHQLFEETVEKDIAFGPKNLGVEEKAIRRLVKNAMQMVGMDYDIYAKKSPFALSGGQKRRVAIAGVLAMNPKYLILDEPTAGLDPKGREDILFMVRNLQKELGITVVLVSHSMDDVAQFADQIIVMEHGKIEMQGKPQEIFAHAQRLTEIGLGVPTVTMLLHKLAEKGWPVRTDIVDIQEAKAEILRYYR